MLRYRLSPFNAWDVMNAVQSAAISTFFNEDRVVRKKQTPVNVYEKDGEQIIQIEIPGFKKEDLKIEVKSNHVDISGRRVNAKDEKRKFLHSERGDQEFQRTFKLPYQIAGEKVTAELKHGVLTLTLPKAESEKPREISVL